MKKKILLGIVVIIVLIVIILLGIKKYKKSDKYIIAKGYKLYGSDRCPGWQDMMRYSPNDYNRHQSWDIQIVSEEKCNLCGEKFMCRGSNIAICDKCLSITNRCCRCGKLN